MLQNLKFFNKKGYELTPLNVSGVYTFKVLLEPVSQNLFETEHIYIFEEVFKRVTNVIDNEVDKDYLNNKNTLLYRFLSSIRNLKLRGLRATSERLQDVFILDKIFNDEPLEYAKRIQNYVTINFDTEYHFELSFSGESFIENYEKDAQEDELLKLGYKKYFVKPRANYSKNAGEETFFVFRWQNNNDEKMFLFDVTDSTEPFSNKYNLNTKKITENFPLIIPYKNDNLDFRKTTSWKTLSEKFTFDSGVFDEVYDETYQQRLLGLDEVINNRPFQLNIAINSDEPGQISRTLDVFVYRKRKNYLDDIYSEEIFKICEFEFTTEVIAEEERFTKLLENFGRKIDQDDFYVLKDFDLDDDNLDYIKINEKRKELLLEGEEIFTYLGSYRSLKSVFKWLGYKDLTFREYFYNIKTFDPKNNIIHYRSVDFDVAFEDNIQFEEGQNVYPYLKYGDVLTSDIWKKTTRYGLIYKYNQYADDDEYGEPIVDEIDNFSPEEMLIKLYGLKKILYKYFLPHNARIINITAEGLYFTKIRLQTWKNINHTTNFSKKPNFDFTVVDNKSKLTNIDDLLLGLCFKDLKTKTKISDWINLEVPGDNSFLKNYKNFPLKLFINNYLDEIKNKNTYIEIENNLTCDILKEKIEWYIGENNYKKTGFFVFDLNLNEVKISDINVPINFFKIDAINCAVLDANNEPGSPDIELDTKIWELGYCGESYPDTIYTFDNFLFGPDQIVEWTIESEDGKFKVTEKGSLKDLKRIYSFVPFVGFYNVSAKIYDHCGFPLTKVKLDYVEVVDDVYDILAFGRYVLDPTLENLKEYKISEISTNLSDNIFCPLESTLDEMDVEMDVLNYSNYLSQEYHHPFIKETNINSINRITKEIILDECEFHTDYHKWKVNYKNEFKCLLVNYSDVKIRDEKVLDIRRNNVYLKNAPNYKNGEYVQIYEKYQLSNFSVRNNTILISGSLFQKFRNGDLIELVQDGIGLEYKSKHYKIIDINIDYINNVTNLEIENDGSLDYDYSFEHDTNYTHNYSYWSKLIYRTNEHSFYIKDVVYDELIDNYVLELDGKWKTLKKLNIVDLYCRYGIVQGEYELNLSDETVSKNTNGTITLDVKDFSDFCKVDTNFKFLWCEFDILRAKNLTYFDNISYKKINNVKLEMLKHQTLDTLEFHSKPITGFKIKNIDRLSIPLFIDNELRYDRVGKLFISHDGITETYELKLPRLQTPFLNKQDTLEWKHQSIQDYLNSINYGVLKQYYFIRNGNRYIEAIQKPGSSAKYFTMRSEVVTLNEYDNFPKYSWIKNDAIEWNGLNNPPNYLHLYSRWNNVDKKPETIEKSLQGSFNLSETFIKKKSFVAPIGTPMFITIDRKKDFDLDRYEFNWKFFNEETNELYLKSKLHYFTWWFLENGIYGLELEIFDKSTETTRTIKKRSFIEIR